MFSPPAGCDGACLPLRRITASKPVGYLVRPCLKRFLLSPERSRLETKLDHGNLWGVFKQTIAAFKEKSSSKSHTPIKSAMRHSLQAPAANRTVLTAQQQSWTSPAVGINSKERGCVLAFGCRATEAMEFPRSLWGACPLG